MRVQILAFTIILMLLLITLVSASSSTLTGKVVSGFSSFIDFVKSKLSGKATTQSVNINITVPNTDPKVTYVASVTNQIITEGGEKGVGLSFIVYDHDGYENIEGANATITNITGGIRQNLTCKKMDSLSAKEQNFSCTVDIWYFDNPGQWNITIKAKDLGGGQGINDTTSFVLLETTAMSTTPTTITWPILQVNSVNKTATDNLQIDNLGNRGIGLGNISVNTTNLVGETYSTYSIYAGNISIGTIQGNASCNQTTSNLMTRYSYVNITEAILPYGNRTAGGGQGIENLYFCIRKVGIELFMQNYSTAGEGAWTIKIT